MRVVYPIVISKGDNYFVVSIPDFESGTQGRDLADAIYMARDAIGLLGIDMEDDGKELPEPYSATITKENDEDIVTLVDVDFTEYRNKVNNKAVKKNCTIPYWLSVEADKQSLNYSKVLQEGLISTLSKNKRQHNKFNSQY
jgi:predicted RNase H-like HicB family nuclease